MIKDKVNDIEVNIINVNDPEDLVLVKSVFEDKRYINNSRFFK